jgi:hypothetical protein
MQRKRVVCKKVLITKEGGKIMEVGLNQAVLGRINKKTEELESDYDLGTTWVRRTVHFNILYSYGKEQFEELVVPVELSAFLELGESYLFFFDKKHQSLAPVVKSFLPCEGAHDWVESLGNSDKLSPEYRNACKALALSEKEKKKRWEEMAAKGYVGEGDIPF